MSQSNQRQMLDAALTLIRQFVPGATSVHLATWDQDIHGFALIDVVTDAGARLSRTEPRLLMNLIDDTHQFLGDLDRDALFGEMLAYPSRALSDGESGVPGRGLSST